MTQARTEYDDAIDLIKQTYDGITNVAISPAGNGFYVVGIKMGDMALSGTFKGGKDFVSSILPLYSQLKTMTKQVKIMEEQREKADATKGTGILG